MKKNTKILLGLAAVAGAYWLWKKNYAPTIYTISEEPIKSPAPPKKDEEPLPYNIPTATVDEFGLVIR